MLKRLLITVATLSFAGLALAAAPTKIADTALGKVLVDSQGMTLYTFAKDSAASPPVTAPAPRTGHR